MVDRFYKKIIRRYIIYKISFSRCTRPKLAYLFSSIIWNVRSNNISTNIPVQFRYFIFGSPILIPFIQYFQYHHRNISRICMIFKFILLAFFCFHNSCAENSIILSHYELNAYNFIKRFPFVQTAVSNTLATISRANNRSNHSTLVASVGHTDRDIIANLGVK